MLVNKEGNGCGKNKVRDFRKKDCNIVVLRYLLSKYLFFNQFLLNIVMSSSDKCTGPWTLRIIANASSYKYYQS